MNIKEILKLAFLQALEKDNTSKPTIGLLDSRENNITSHLRAALENILRKDNAFDTYQVDEEYDKEGVDGNCKTYVNDFGAIKEERPDIIIHKRGTKHIHDQDANYAFIEIKVIKDFNGKVEQISSLKTKSGLEKDLRKINDALQNKQYKYGISLVIATDTIFIKLNNEEYSFLISNLHEYILVR